MIHTITITRLSMIDWIDFIAENRYRKIKPTKLIVDLTHAFLASPYILVSLGCLIEEYHQKGVEVEFRRNQGGAVDIYLENLGIFDYWKPNFDRTSYHRTKVSTALPLWKVSFDMIDMYTPYAQKYFQDNYLEEQDLSPLHIVLAEVMNNINDHSASKVSGYCLTQYYPDKHELVIAVCDFGIGIPNKINRYLKSIGRKPIRQEKALKKSLENGYSTKSAPHNRGYGLHTILSNVNVTAGSLRIISNKAQFWQQTDENPVIERLERSFGGTFIIITLNTLMLEGLESELVNEDIIL